MVNLKHRVMDQTRRQINRRLRIEICCIVGIHNHKAPDDRMFNTVDVIMRDRPAKNDKYRFRYDVIVPPTYVGGNCMGDTRSPRVGDVVVVLFYADREGYVLGPAWSWAEYPVCRPTPYDIAKKGGQWMKPYQDEWSDFSKEPYPKVKKPYCDRWFHGPVKGTTGRGRDWARVYDYCQEGDANPDCSTCKTIDSIGRDKNSWDKVYSHETESCEAPNKRREIHVPCGSALRFESESGPSVVYSEGNGHIQIQGATCENCPKGHITHYPDGSWEVQSETSSMKDNLPCGARVRVYSHESEGDIAAEMIWYDAGNPFIRIMKDGEVVVHSPTKITLDAPLVEETQDNKVDGDNTVVGFCAHGGCSCP